MADPEVVKLQAQLHKLQGQFQDAVKERDNLNKGACRALAARRRPPSPSSPAAAAHTRPPAPTAPR
jgi:hypothetical protein